MSRGGQVTAEAVRQMLVGLADALRTAQDTLSADASSGEGGGGRMGYEIPYLDFSFEVEFSSKEGEGGAAPILALRPRFGSSPTTDTTKEITSQVSGRLVSVPPHDGKPAPLLDLRLEGEGDGSILAVELTNLAGEIMSGVPVALELDLEMTERLMGRSPDAEERLTLLGTQVVRTDAAGRARVPLTPSVLGEGGRVVVRAEARGASARIVVTHAGGGE